MKVFIYSIPRQSAFGIHDWTSDSSGVKLLKTKIGKTKDKIPALFSPKYGGLANGLSYKPWIQDGTQVKDEKGNPLTLQHKMEKKWNLPEGYLTHKSWRKGDPIKEENWTYFQRMAWKLNDGSTVLDLDLFELSIINSSLLDGYFIELLCFCVCLLLFDILL